MSTKKRSIRTLRGWWIFLLSLPLFYACEVIPLYEVELVGEITVAGSPITTGTLHIRVYHAESGEGALAHPLGGPITSFTLQAKGKFTQRVEVPTQKGRGLVVYAWHDQDDDGIFCKVNQNNERSGILELKDFPKPQLKFQLDLDATCAGPEAIYP